MLDKNSNCNYGEQIVSFLYGEIEGAEKMRFEAHLKDCASCADELTEFSAVRSSVLEWRNEEFENLSTPAFVMPKNSGAAENSNSWKNYFRGFFRFNTLGISAAATAALLIVFGLFWFYLNSSVTDEIAENGSTSNTNSEKMLIPESLSNMSRAETTAKTDVETAKVSESLNDSENNRSERKEVAVKTAVQKNIEIKQDVKIKKTSVKTQRTTDKLIIKTEKNNNLPTLAVDDYEDNSLRLSDILEEVSMK